MSDTLITLHTEIAALQADIAALRSTALAYDAAIQRLADREPWVGSDELDALYIRWVSAAQSTGSGTAILAELEAARTVVGTLREWMAGDVSRSALTIALIDYDKATQARTG